jgi:hypothetical protein
MIRLLMNLSDAKTGRIVFHERDLYPNDVINLISGRGIDRRLVRHGWPAGFSCHFTAFQKVGDRPSDLSGDL